MAFVDVIRNLKWRVIARNAVVAVLIFVPYLDQETLGVIPVVRDLLPVPSIYLTRLSWRGRARWVILVLLPYVDGEIISFFTGGEVTAKTIVED